MSDTTSHRSDPEIFADVRRALDQRPMVPQGVHAHVDRGVVRLTGSVQRPLERTEAEDATRGIAGVRRVLNEIVLTQRPSAEGFEPPDQA